MSKPEQKTGLMIGLPTRGKPVAFEWAMCFALQNYPMNVFRTFMPVKERTVDEARNVIVHVAQQQKAKYLWMLDDDTAPPFYAAKRLMYDLEMADDDVMVAGGIYGTKEEQSEPTVYRGNGNGPFWKWKKGEVFEVTGIGTGCMMIKMELFDKLPQPAKRLTEIKRGEKKVEIPWWFNSADHTPTTDEEVRGVTADENGGVDTGWQQSDDLYFCDQVISAGFKIIADGTVLCLHWDCTVDPPRAYYPPYSIKDEIAEGQIAV